MHIISLTFIFQTRNFVLIKILLHRLAEHGKYYYCFEIILLLHKIFTVPLPKNDEGPSLKEGSNSFKCELTQDLSGCALKLL